MCPNHFQGWRSVLICQKGFDDIASQPINLIRLSANGVVLALSLWGIFAAVTVMFDITVYFPFRIADDKSIPEHRWQSARLANFLTFAYYGFVHLLNGSKEVYLVCFLKVFLFFLTIVGTVIFIKTGVSPLEYAVPVFFAGCFVILHIASRPSFKRYFSRK